MTVPTQLYRPSLALLTDFYELTMAYAAWKSGIARREASFVLSSDEVAGLRVEARGLTVPFVGRFDYGADVPMSERHVEDIKRGRNDRLVRLMIALAVVAWARLSAPKPPS